MFKILNIFSIKMVLFFVIFASFYSCHANKNKKNRLKNDNSESQAKNLPKNKFDIDDLAYSTKNKKDQSNIDEQSTNKPIINEYMTSQEAYTEVKRLIKEINGKLCQEKVGIYTKRNKTVQFPSYNGRVEITNPQRVEPSKPSKASKASTKSAASLSEKSEESEESEEDSLHEYKMVYHDFHNEKFKLEQGTMSDSFIFKGVKFQGFGKKTQSNIGNYEFHFFPKNNLEDKQNYLKVSVNVNAKYSNLDNTKCDKFASVFIGENNTQETISDKMVSMVYKLPNAEPEKIVLTEDQKKEFVNAVRGVTNPASPSKPGVNPASPSTPAIKKS